MQPEDGLLARRTRAWGARSEAAAQLALGLMATGKLRLTSLVVGTALAGSAVAAAEVGSWRLGPTAGVLAGVWLCCWGAGVLNQVYERERDARMLRTRRRPLATEQV